MRKHYLLLITLLLLSYTSYSQTYTFDYVLEYKTETVEDTITNFKQVSTFYRFFKSNDNSKALTVWEKGKLTKIELIPYDNKFHRGEIPTENFFVEALSMKCPRSGVHHTPNYRPKDYKLVNYSDTVINTLRYSRVDLQPVNKRRYKKMEIFRESFIIDNSLNFSVPLIFPLSVLHKLWEKGTKVPNGVIKDLKGYDVNGREVYHMELKSIFPISKIIIVDRTSCDW